MPLTPGTRLGAYEIIAPLGAGGMGEVYRGRDTRLDRTVAIKILSGALSADPESRVRFEHEARAIAALNHPHICTIHDVGRHEDVDYLVMEYLEGETLADRIKRGGGSASGTEASKGAGLPLDEALALAIQIGDALDRAHRAGIVHRDLKPGNVMLVRGAQSGVSAKLLDFGLAARTDAAAARPPAGDASLLQTMAPSLMATRPPSATPTAGFSGTMQYMAPEQMDGQLTDHRADIFAFGCVLYEMLAGRKAFEGATSVTVIAAIMGSEPKPIAALASAPPVLDHLLRRCLEKDPERRWQSIGDVTGELRWIAAQPLTLPSHAAALPPARRPMSVWQWAALVTGVLVVLVGLLPLAMLGAVRWLRGPETAVEQPAFQFEISTPPTDDASLALSPDGAQLAYVAYQDRRPMLWVRTLTTLESRVLAGTEGALLPFWSPDGRTIGFFADDKLKRIDVGAGAPLVITDAPNARGGAWSRDGVILFAPGVRAPIMRVAAGGGAVEAVTTLNASAGPSHRLPEFLPDGKRFLFRSTLGTDDTNGLYLGSLDKTPPVLLLAGEGLARLAPPGMILAVRQGALVAVRFNEESGAIEGEPVVVGQGPARGAAIGGFTTSATGVMAYRAGAGQIRQFVWVNRQGQTLGTIGEPDSDGISAPELSPDERSLALFTGRTGENDVWVVDLTRNVSRRITDGPPADAHPIWDPDGQHLLYVSRRLGGDAPVRQAVSGGKPEPLFAPPVEGQALSWTRDRRFVLMRPRGGELQGNSDLVAVSTDAAQTSVPVAQSKFDEREGQFSPDGQWVAFVSNETGRPEVFVQSFPAGGSRTQVSAAGGTDVRWAPDGSEVFYVAPDGRMMAVPVALAGPSAPVLKAPVALFPTRLASGFQVLGSKAQYVVSRDGRFLLNTAIEAPSTPIVVSVNWQSALKR